MFETKHRAGSALPDLAGLGMALVLFFTPVALQLAASVGVGHFAFGPQRGLSSTPPASESLLVLNITLSFIPGFHSLTAHEYTVGPNVECPIIKVNI